MRIEDAMNRQLLKAVLWAIARVGGAAVLVYISLGAIIFPEWWKEFLTGGVFKMFIWRDGFHFLKNQITSFTPLAALILFGLLSALGYVTFWCGRHFSESVKTKTIFFKNLPPSLRTVFALMVISSIMLFAACQQSGSYSAGKSFELQQQILLDGLKQIGNWGQSPFVPPETGVYLYLNEKLIIKQFQALQNDMEPKQKTESTGNEQESSASVSLPASVGTVTAGGKVSNGQTLTFNAPDISPGFVAGRIIKRFVSDTNTINWVGILHPMTSSSKFVVLIAANNGINLSDEQKVQLAAHDKSQYEANVSKVIPHKMLLYDGTVRLFKSAGRLAIEMSEKGPITVTAKGYVENQYLADSLLFAFEGKQEGRELSGVKVLAIIDDKQTDGEGNVVISITPECIW